MSEPEISVGADVDVRALMEEIHAEVERKRRAGAYPPDVLAELDLAFTPGGREDDTLRRVLSELRRTSGFSAEITTASRKPVVAPVVTRMKGAIRTSLRWYLTGILQQVQAFAGNTVRAVGLLSDRLARLEEQVGELALERDEPLSLRARLDAIESSAAEDRIRDRLATLDRSVRDIRNRLEDGGGVVAAPGGGPEAPRSWRAERAFDYFDFENRFRGSEEAITERQRTYVDLFRDAPGPVVDLGCGRGEFLRLLREAGIESYGIDRHPDMVSRCRELGLDVREKDSLEHLSDLGADTLGGIFCAQMIEHLDVPDVPGFFELAADALRPGGTLVVETINPQSLFVFAAAFYVDLGHLRPLHPLTLRFLAEKSGFADVDVRYFSPPPDDLRPQALPRTGDVDVDVLVERLDENFRRIDDLLFGPQDYAVVATR